MKHTPPKALYVHVPFCLGKCTYCDFYSVVKTADGVKTYLDALGRELQLTTGECPGPMRTVYVGGGTPTALSAAELEGLLSLLHEGVGFAEVTEFTVEANPGTLSGEKLDVLRTHGVNRLSIGAQSFNDRLLGVLGRRHSASDVRRALEASHGAGLSNLNLDLIFGIPTQTVDDWRRDLDALLACDVPHVSTYALTYEEGTPLALSAAAGEVVRVREDDDLRMYETTVDTLVGAGYVHYEISNFAHPGFACAHNEAYWANASYVGLGPSAVSYIDGERRRNVASIDDYARMLAAGNSPANFREHLTGEKRARETAIMNLRRTRGIDFGTFRRHTGFDATTFFVREFQALSADGLVEVGEGGARLTRRGLMVADSVLGELV